MNENYRHFNEKRMHLFGELVKRYWNGELQNLSDLNALAERTRRNFGFGEADMPFIKDQIRVAVGLDPTGDLDFSDVLKYLKDSKTITGPVVAHIKGPCIQCKKKQAGCTASEKYESDMYRRGSIPTLQCIDWDGLDSECEFGALAEKMEFMPVVDMLKDPNIPVYAALAPAIVGQFGDAVSMGQLRSALKMIGFQDAVEVALFADILTIREAFEFNHLVKNEEDYFLTSCCCPIWFNMVKKSYPEIHSKLSPTVSPMIASGRILKKLYPEARVVFIAPCVAKKAEIKEPDLVGAIDYVLNFRELDEIFKALDIELDTLPSDEKDQASLGGRIYARSGGVSFSVKTIVNRLEPSRVIKLKAQKVNGIQPCKTVLDELRNGIKTEANFIEGMGCAGGCVGGPRTNIDVNRATKLVNDFAEESHILTPFDNQNIVQILQALGMTRVEDILENEDMKKLLSRG